MFRQMYSAHFTIDDTLNQQRAVSVIFIPLDWRRSSHSINRQLPTGHRPVLRVTSNRRAQTATVRQVTALLTYAPLESGLKSVGHARESCTLHPLPPATTAATTSMFRGRRCFSWSRHSFAGGLVTSRPDNLLGRPMLLLH